MYFLRLCKKDKKIESRKNKLVKIGSRDISMPLDHMLDDYLKTYPRYDQALGEIARIIHKHIGEFTAIDIGANIGDSAALICKYQNIPVLCVEGCDFFIPYLKENVAEIYNQIKIVECFVGEEASFIRENLLDVRNGTASMASKIAIKEASKSKASFRMKKTNIRSLEDILLENDYFKNAALVKIDTDGFDFSIIIQSIKCFEKNKPVIFFEYDPSYKTNNDELALQAIKSLLNIGYKHFLVYDNFGNFLTVVRDENSFCDLNAYLAINRKNKQIIYYFDVCVIGEDNKSIFEDIRNYELLHSK